MEQLYADLAAAGIPVRYTHCMSTELIPKPHDEWSYAQALADMAGPEALRCGPWVQRLQQLMAGGILRRPDTFRWVLPHMRLRMVIMGLLMWQSLQNDMHYYWCMWAHTHTRVC